ncbi:hypothetical protein Vretifemale_4831 [Volvox reticuliferus]|uniref:Uncharacterized protein n=1 Tax=Volvox reticuliferus TaxID=1737510 RepID=A0A8J4C3R2_9CHLO|nr:hypothetical protein Vretifemale_4831 [Volvox reticuliferus]
MSGLFNPFAEQEDQDRGPSLYSDPLAAYASAPRPLPDISAPGAMPILSSTFLIRFVHLAPANSALHCSALHCTAARCARLHAPCMHLIPTCRLSFVFVNFIRAQSRATLGVWARGVGPGRHSPGRQVPWAGRFNAAFAATPPPDAVVRSRWWWALVATV